MKDLGKYLLDYDVIYSYFKEHLEEGKTLANVILKKNNFSKGFFYTILPENAHFERIDLFKYGGIIPQEKEKRSIDFFGKRAIYQELTSTRDNMIQIIEQYLNQNREGKIILEDILRYKGEKFTLIENVNLSFYNKEVYYVLSYSNSKHEIAEAINKAENVWHFIAILIPKQIEIPQEFDDSTLSQLSSHIEAMIIVAYDGESFIFWEKGKPSKYPDLIYPKTI